MQLPVIAYDIFFIPSRNQADGFDIHRAHDCEIVAVYLKQNDQSYSFS